VRISPATNLIASVASTISI
jgi:ankyrin repeat protein